MLPVVVTSFTPWASLFGGILVGLSAVMVMVLFGRIAGITGISTGAMSVLMPNQDTAKDWSWRLTFILGLIAAPLVVSLLGGTVMQSVPDNLIGMVIAGLCVGIGTAVGSGCTSGHGVCGLARVSPRSLVAVVTFLSSGAVTVYLLRHVWS